MIALRKAPITLGLYCRGVAEFYLLLRETIGPGEPGKNDRRYLWATKRNWFGLGKRRLSPGAPLTFSQIEERQLWLKRAANVLGKKLTPVNEKYTSKKAQLFHQDLENELEDLAASLQKNPRQLFHLLHALDRGDETYFLYLVLEINDIRTWMEENNLSWFDCLVLSPPPPTPTDPVPPASTAARVPEAWPWQDKKKKLDVARKIARQRQSGLGPRPEGDVEACTWETCWSKEQKEIELHFEFLRRSEFAQKIWAWVQAEAQRKEDMEKNAASPANMPTASDHATKSRKDAPLLEQLVCCIFFSRNLEEKDNLLKELAARLYRSPSEQSKLALLLGKTPSRWLREEEAASLWRRRKYHGEPDPSMDDLPCLKRLGIDPAKPADPKNPTAWLDDVRTPPRNLTGLCFSGGGIRSATFNLGILQALAELKLLGKFDYLSTVSGGGYIHQWLAAWWKRESASERETPGIETSAFETVRKALVAQPASTLPGIEPTQISFLRRFSNYLTPHVGAFTADTWTMIAIWMRNTFLVLLIVIAALLVVLSLLRAGIVGLNGLANCYNIDRWWIAPTALAPLLTLCGAAWILVWFRHYTAQINDPARNAGREAREETGARDRSITAALVFMFLGALFFTVICLGSPATFYAIDSPLLTWLFSLFFSLKNDGLLGTFILWPVALGWFGFARQRYHEAHPTSRIVWRYIQNPLTGLLSGALVWFLLAAALRFFWRHLPCWWFDLICFTQDTTVRNTLLSAVQGMAEALVSYVESDPTHHVQQELVFVFAPPLLMMALFLGSVLHLGLNKQVFRDEILEWLARLRSLGFLVSFGWLAATGSVVLAGPLFAAISGLKAAIWWSFATLAWGSASGAGASAATKGVSNANSLVTRYGRPLLIALAPWVFVVGLFLGLAALVSAATTDQIGMTNWAHLGLLSILALAIAVLYGWQMDINEMSMFAFYRNRLARCYQGASVLDRKPDPFTGFSPDDRSLGLAELRYQPPSGVKGTYPGPFPIFCCTLNFSAGEELAWQERKGASFAYTPLYSGYDIPWTGIDRKGDDKLFYNGFRDTTDMGKPFGPPLADVCAASGAAASPMDGYRTTTGLAFLMTCFNVRLGVWKRNTRHIIREESAVQTVSPDLEPQSPRFSLWPLFGELFGNVSAKQEFLYLSDGGHFDNMGLYELVRRDCRYIVICDAECDGDLDFEGLAMAVRKCRTDFGVDIQLDVKKLRKDKDSAFSGVHCVVGTILFPNEDPHTPYRDRGKIVYLKSTMTGSEPADLLSYKLEHPEFPHDTTADQWFSESQFESYRNLGRFIAMTSLKNACPNDANGEPVGGSRTEYFNRMYDAWYPATPAIEQYLTKHGERFEALIAELRKNGGHAQSVHELFDKNLQAFSLPEGHRHYYDALALSIFDFIWQVFNDLDLHIASNREHPQAEVWINTFKRWLEMRFMKDAWTVYQLRYPESFHFFLKQHLNF